MGIGHKNFFHPVVIGWVKVNFIVCWPHNDDILHIQLKVIGANVQGLSKKHTVIHGNVCYRRKRLQKIGNRCLKDHLLLDAKVHA